MLQYRSLDFSLFHFKIAVSSSTKTRIFVLIVIPLAIPTFFPHQKIPLLSYSKRILLIFCRCCPKQKSFLLFFVGIADNCLAFFLSSLFLRRTKTGQNFRRKPVTSSKLYIPSSTLLVQHSERYKMAKWYLVLPYAKWPRQAIPSTKKQK